ncbi:ArsR family transcriptional regulator [Comamonas fluminis]|uniref:HVO_A0114 family putative DNA-binding protein n=1 Tax=Comamonas fluminis TaxID=2796366 RepID=UPI001C46E667|nr:ArsR family transcriptional regulator [Comamonas fluminis]
MTKLKTQIGTEADFFRRGRLIAKAADAGQPIPETHLLTFAEPADLMEVFTPKRVELFKAIKAQSDSITNLAERVKRDRASVSRDLTVLEKAGMVIVRKRPHPGHGLVKEAKAIAKKITLSVVI